MVKEANLQAEAVEKVVDVERAGKERDEVVDASDVNPEGKDGVDRLEDVEKKMQIEAF